MNVVNFYPKTLDQIPAQDNPIIHGDECLLIIGANFLHGNSNDVVVFYVHDSNPKTDEDKADSIGVFWKLEVAEAFCQSFKPENFIITVATDACIHEVGCFAMETGCCALSHCPNFREHR